MDEQDVTATEEEGYDAGPLGGRIEFPRLPLMKELLLS